MSENARPAANPVVITLIVVVVVLAAGLGYLIWKNNNSVPAVGDVSTTSNTATTATSTAGTPTGAGGASIVPADFDAKTATKVASGTTPEKWVDQYYTAADKGDWKTAFNHLPAAKQTGSSPDALKQQVAGYGVVGYKITSSATKGNEATIIVDQETSQYGTFQNTWVFKKVGDTWVVAGKAVTGMK